MYLHRGADLFYLTGINRGGASMTDHNTYGDYMQGAYIGADDGFILVGPRMGGRRWHAMAEDKPYIDEVRIVDESESPKKVMGEVLGKFKLDGKGVMIDDRAWAHGALLLQHHLPTAKISLANEIIAPMRMTMMVMLVRSSTSVNPRRWECRTPMIVLSLWGAVTACLPFPSQRRQ